MPNESIWIEEFNTKEMGYKGITADALISPYPNSEQIIEMLRNTPVIGVEGFPQNESEAKEWNPPEHLINLCHTFYVKGYNSLKFG